ncbi:hypothetical protein Leryth_006290 [Lithospermum erythrorhizon]|nr:hypothetical protein Leryth_006290 [Lithospermum erythrorhizon]
MSYDNIGSSRDLDGNNFTGPIPSTLLKKWHEGTLSLRSTREAVQIQMERQEGYHLSCGFSRSVVCCFTFGFIGLLKKEKEKTRKEKGQNRYTLEPKHKEFTNAEIASITNHFQKEIGRGSYGIVYHGIIGEDIEVAVKMYSSSSSDVGKELQLERYDPASTLQQGDVLDVVDRRLIGMGEFDVPSATKALQVATTCASQDPTERPTMNNVVVELRQCLLMEMTRHELILPKSVHDSVETEVSLMSTEVLYVGR